MNFDLTGEQKEIQKAADEFLNRHPGHKWVQFDVLSISLYDYRDPEIFLIEDVFF